MSGRTFGLKVRVYFEAKWTQSLLEWKRATMDQDQVNTLRAGLVDVAPFTNTHQLIN